MAATTSTRDFQNHTVMMVAAVFIDYMNIDRMGAGVKRGRQAGHPNMRRRLRLDPGLDGFLVAAKHLLDKRIGASLRLHRTGPTSADPVFARGVRPAIEYIDDERGGGELILRERRTLQLPHP